MVLFWTTNRYSVIIEPPIEEAHIQPPPFRFDEPMIAKNYFTDMVNEQEMEFITNIWLSEEGSECDSPAYRRVWGARQHGEGDNLVEIPRIESSKFMSGVSLCVTRSDLTYKNAVTGACPEGLVPCSENTAGVNTICLTPEAKEAGECPITRIDLVPKLKPNEQVDQQLELFESAQLLNEELEPIENNLSYELLFSKDFDAPPIVYMIYSQGPKCFNWAHWPEDPVDCGDSEMWQLYEQMFRSSLENTLAIDALEDIATYEQLVNPEQEAAPDENGRRLQEGGVTSSNDVSTGQNARPESEQDFGNIAPSGANKEEGSELRDRIDQILGESLIENPEDLSDEELLIAASQALIDL